MHITHIKIYVYSTYGQVKAVKSGSVLVVDEADKAPTHVTCILKTLVESGEMHLADGRRIVSGKITNLLWCIVSCNVTNLLVC